MNMISEVPDTGRGVSSRQAGSDDYLTRSVYLPPSPPPPPNPRVSGVSSGESSGLRMWTPSSSPASATDVLCDIRQVP